MKRRTSSLNGGTGLIEKYIGSSFDLIQQVITNLDDILQTSSVMDVAVAALFYKFNATSGQTVFTGLDSSSRTMTIPGAAEPGAVTPVYVNRVLQNPDTYTVATNGLTVTFDTGLADGDLVWIADFAFNTDGTLYFDDLLNHDYVLGVVADVEAAETAAAASAVAAGVSATAADASAVAAAASEAAVLGANISLLDWQGPWVTATPYVIGAVVSEGGNAYVCVADHTSGVFATDLTAVRWEILVVKGDAGDTGSPGTPGTNGTNGTNGLGILSGSGVPSNGLGLDGEFYIDTAGNLLHGPKAAGVWPDGASMVGPQGNPGNDGADGPTGPGVPAGGTASQILTKVDGADYNTMWAAPASGMSLIAAETQGSSITAFTSVVSLSPYKRVKLVSFGDNNVTVPNTMIIQARAAGGTYRTIGEFPMNTNGYGVSCVIENFNNAEAGEHKLITMSGGMLLANFDSTAAENMTSRLTSGGVHEFATSLAFSARTEIWDQIRLVANANNILVGSKMWLYGEL